MSWHRVPMVLGLLYVPVLLLAEDFRDPAGISLEERTRVHTARGEYRRCMQQYARTAMQDSNDPLQVSDAAMKQCASVLEQLHADMLALNYSPEVATGITRSISRRIANRLLGQVTQFIAARTAVAGEDEGDRATHGDNP